MSHNYKIEYTDVPDINVITGGPDNDKYLYYQIQNSIKKAVKIDIIVSFLMESGVHMILEDLRGAINRGAEIRILTGNYLGITQPSALYLLKNELSDKVGLKFYNDTKRSFHAKSYFFEYEDGADIFVGSSNLSRSALTSGIEWNYRFSRGQDSKGYRKFKETFEDLYLNHAIEITDEELEHYSKNWRKPSVQPYIEQYEKTVREEQAVIPLFRPRGAQIEALYALNKCREEGARKALVHAATGERVIIVTGCINILISRVSGTFIKNNSCIA